MALRQAGERQRANGTLGTAVLDDYPVRGRRAAYLVISIVMLVCGLGIYALFRNLNIVLFSWIPKPAFLDTLHISVNHSNPFITFLLYNAPDGLWFLSGLLFIRSVWLTEKKWCAMYASVFCLTACLFEISQLSKDIPGTFDLIDLSLILLISVTEYISYGFIKRRRMI